jgi:cytochrome b subunit of formate dehydrogenase
MVPRKDDAIRNRRRRRQAPALSYFEAIWLLATGWVVWSDLQFGTNPLQIIAGILSSQGHLFSLNIGVAILTVHTLALYCSKAYFDWYCAISGAN